MIEAREIERATVDDLMDLRVHESQRHLVAPNAATIAQGHYEPYAWVRGLWAGDTAVGLIAMVDFRPDDPEYDPTMPKNTAYLWRLMIDVGHQKKGYGRDAMHLAFAQARAWGRETLCLHVIEEPGNALDFYRRFGFERTDRVDEGERLLVAPVPPI